MKRFLFLTVAAALLSPSPAWATLMVQEHETGEKVTLDTETGYYWYYKLTDFTNMTYDTQIDKIADLSTYGSIAGGWHMATFEEMETLWQNTDTAILTQFAQPPSLQGVFWAGRYSRETEYPGAHEAAAFLWDVDEGTYISVPLLDKWENIPSSIVEYPINDEVSADWISSWVVVTQGEVVPVPSAIILAATGMLSAALGLKRLRRKHQE